MTDQTRCGVFDGVNWTSSAGGCRGAGFENQLNILHPERSNKDAPARANANRNRFFTLYPFVAEPPISSSFNSINCFPGSSGEAFSRAV